MYCLFIVDVKGKRFDHRQWMLVQAHDAMYELLKTSENHSSKLHLAVDYFRS